MDRRRFVQSLGAGLAGLSVFAPKGLGVKEARAAAKYGGPFLVTIHASGGWDPTLFCDPKGGTVNKMFAQGAMSGVFPYAPVTYTQDMKPVYSVQKFFDTHHGRLTVVNGIDTTTNNHDVGTRTVWSGSTIEGAAALAAVFAGVKTKDVQVPMAFLSNGGYDATNGAVALTRAGSVDALKRIAFPNRADPNKDDSPLYFSPDTLARINDAQLAKLQAGAAKSRLPVAQHGMSSLYLARQGNAGLDQLAAALAATKTIDLDDVPDLKGIGNLGDLEDLMRQAQLALTAFSAGVAVSASLTIGGFDTHSDHDNAHIPRMLKLLRGVDYLFQTADALGISNSLYVMVGSDFGRTPSYNNAQGKDHWNVTSMAFSVPGVGDRLVGASTPDFKPMSFDPGTLQPSEGGVRIGTNNIHIALRKMLGIDGTDVANANPIQGDALPIFG